MAQAFERLVTRSDKVAFMEVGGAYKRMQYFTSLSKSANPIEYSRSYVDQPSEVTDVTGYSPSYEYAFDAYEGNEVLDDLITIYDDEKIGTDAIRNILVVDMTSKDQTGAYSGLKRAYSVIPDAEGDGTEAYTYSGTFRSNGEQEHVRVTVSEDGLTATLVEGTQALSTEKESRSRAFR